MLRITHQNYPTPLSGLNGISIGGIDVSSIANAVVNSIMPAVSAQMPNLVAAAWPAVQERVPGLIDQAWGQVQQKAPAMVSQLAPQAANAALPALYAKLPEIRAKLMPIVKKEIDSMIEGYANQYLGPAAALKGWYPAIGLFASAVTLFGAGIVIYQFWAGER
jgi:hypothetical protein